MAMKPYSYLPDELYDLGGAGEHPITLTAWIDTDTEFGRERKSVNIVSAVVKVTYGDLVQELDITRAVLGSPYSRELWEDEIWNSYKASLERSWDLDEGA